MTTSPGRTVPQPLELRSPVPGAPPGPADAPELWLLDLTEPHGMADEDLTSLLSVAETERAAAFRFPRDRDRYTACHAGLRLLLGARLGCPPREVPIFREDCLNCGEPHGRPAVAGGPHFSLSHTRSLGLIALADRPVGVDLEPVPDLTVTEGVAPRLHPTERAELDALPPWSRPLAFARAWVRSEAYLKGLGTGLTRAPSLDYLGTGPTPAQPPGWTVTDVPLPATLRTPTHTAALAHATS